MDGGWRGAGRARGGTYSLSGTIGQPDAGTLSNGSTFFYGGFWVPSAETAYQPDMLIRTGAESRFTGDGIYNKDATSQTKKLIPACNATGTFVFRAQNDGGISDILKITGTAGGGGWAVQFLDGATDITAQVTSTAGYSTGALASGAYKELSVTMTPTASVPVGTSRALWLTAVSQGDATKKDVVRAIGTVLKRQGDLWIRRSTDASYVGDNIINTDATGQTRATVVAINTTATYLFYAQNDGNVDDTVTVTGPTGDSHWSVLYYEMGTNSDITSQVTGAGYSTGMLPPNGSKGFYGKVKPLTGAAAGATKDLLITAVSATDNTKKDIAKASTSVLLRQPDLQLRPSADASYTGDNVYNADGTGQSKTIAVTSTRRRSSSSGCRTTATWTTA